METHKKKLLLKIIYKKSSGEAYQNIKHKKTNSLFYTAKLSPQLHDLAALGLLK